MPCAGCRRLAEERREGASISVVRTCAHPEGSPNCWHCAAEKAAELEQQLRETQDRATDLEYERDQAFLNADEALNTHWRRVFEGTAEQLSEAQQARKQIWLRWEAASNGQLDERLRAERAEAQLDALRQALTRIREVAHEESLSEFSRLVAITTIISALEPLTEDEKAAGEHVAGALLAQGQKTREPAQKACPVCQGKGSYQSELRDVVETCNYCAGSGVPQTPPMDSRERSRDEAP